MAIREASYWYRGWWYYAPDSGFTAGTTDDWNLYLMGGEL